MNGVTPVGGDDDRARGVVTVVVALLVVTAGLAVLVDGVPTGGPDAEAVAENARDAYDRAESYSAVAVVTYENGSEETRTARATVLYEQPRKHRVEVTAPDRVAGAVLATNGTVAWARNGSNGTVRQVPVKGANRTLLRPEVALDRVLRNASFELEGRETLDGTETYVLSADDDGANGTATVWVAADDWHVTKLRVENASADRAATVRYREFRFNASIHDSAFEPPNATAVLRPGDVGGTVYDRFAAVQANTSVELPAPDFGQGLAFERATVVDRDGNETTVQVYANGSARVLVTTSEATGVVNASAGEAVEVAGGDARLVSERGRLVVTWERGGLTYAVAGDLPREALLEFASTVARAAAG